MATINSFQGDASSFSPSSERLEKLWVVCVFTVFTRLYAALELTPRLRAEILINAALESTVHYDAAFIQ